MEFGFLRQEGLGGCDDGCEREVVDYEREDVGLGVEFFDGSYGGVGFFVGAAAEVYFGFVLGEVEDAVVPAVTC